MRALAVLIVVLSHAGFEQVVPGSTGVTIFFTISGFVITTILLRERAATGGFAAGAFYTKRAFKLLPPLVVVVLIPTLIYSLFVQINWIEFGSQIFFLFNFFYMNGLGTGVLPGSGVVWSLAIEEQFYIAFALYWLFAARRAHYARNLVILASIVIATSMVLRAILWSVGADDIRILYGTDTRADSIAIGILAALAIEGKARLPRTSAFLGRNIVVLIVVALFALSAVLRFVFYKEVFRFSVESVATALLISFGLLSAGGRLFSAMMRLARLKIVQVVGLASYSIYLVHLILMKALLPHIQAWPVGVRVLLLATVGVCAGLLVWRFIEVPSLSLRDRIMSRNRGDAEEMKATSASLDVDGPRTLAVAVRRIAFGDGVGGMERAASQHVEGMTRLGYSVTLYTPMASVAGSVPPGVAVVDVPWPAWNRSRRTPLYGLAYRVWTRTLAKVLLSAQPAPATIHFHAAAVGALWNRKLRLASPKSVVNTHGMEAFGSFSLLRVPNRIFLRRLLRGARSVDAVISTDESLRIASARNTGLPVDRVIVIPNSVDSDELNRLARGATAFDVFTIVTIGRIVHNKGYDLLATALAQPRVAATLPADFQWVHFGDGPERDRVVGLAVELGVSLSVKSGRSDQEVQQSLSVADLFIQPSRYEGSSLTTLEAMAHGRRIVGTRVGGIPDKIIDGETGTLADHADAEEIANAIVRAMSPGALRLGDAARIAVEARFSAVASASQYDKLYRQFADADHDSASASAQGV
jgi:peptidoglycan/LPS O-acetylase OafA/YrhL/glycosyltransferase involved in cell wall biosynthesis